MSPPSRAADRPGSPRQDRPARQGQAHCHLGQPPRPGLLPGGGLRGLNALPAAGGYLVAEAPPRPPRSAVLRCDPGRARGRYARGGQDLARLIKQACRAAGPDPAKFSSHSLPRGLLTNAGALQLRLVDIMRQSRHKSAETALGYIADGDAWRNNITAPVFGRDPAR
jgi:hypothetical protein